MVGILESLIKSLGTSVLYNANGTTLFYDFAPRLKEAIPGLRIIDHLFDHRIGYINSYDESTSESVDACVAENHRVAEALTNDLGWPKNRVPVIWPCGRAPTALPAANSRETIRQEIRKTLGIGSQDVLYLSAARTHAQKRPLDLVELAVRTSDIEHVHYLLVGGGDLEGEVDAAIEERKPLRIRRLPFRNDIPDLILAADVGILVSEFEGLPVFMLECLQLGTPFIGTDVGDIRTVLEETGAGIVAGEPGDLSTLENAVRRMADSLNRQSYADRARDAGPRFDVQPCAHAYARVFNGEF
jgi:glycosyltransferase involved in cell wall biosynthesis